MPVQNRIHKISACPDLATHHLQILTPITLNSLLYQKGPAQNYTHVHVYHKQNSINRPYIRGFWN